jgi:N-hydroxyarylamine O-acetyltransferase
MDAFDRDAWLNRIGYTGPLEPTLTTLASLVKAHSHAIAYESIDIVLGTPAVLDIASLQRKMIERRRGGYCFEQNMLFRAGLRSLGYAVTSLQGRVVRGLEIDAPRPAIHMLLRVELPEGAYLADVGFGNLAPTAPLLLEPHIEQPTPHEVMRFIIVNDELTLQSKLGDRWEHIYRVIPHPRNDAEYEITNWYTSTHPSAPYLSNIIAALPAPDGARLTLFNERLTRRFADGHAERQQLQSEAEYQRVIREEFGLTISDQEIRAAIKVVDKRRTRGAPHPFFA